MTDLAMSPHASDEEIAALVEGEIGDDSSPARHVEICSACFARLLASDVGGALDLIARRARDGLGSLVPASLPPDLPAAAADRLSAREQDILRRLASPASLSLLEREWPDRPATFWRALEELRERLLRERREMVLAARDAVQGGAADFEPPIDPGADDERAHEPWATVERLLSMDEPGLAGGGLKWIASFVRPGGRRGTVVLTTSDGLTTLSLRGIGRCFVALDLPRHDEESWLAGQVREAGIYRLVFCDDDQRWRTILDRFLRTRRGIDCEFEKTVRARGTISGFERAAIRILAPSVSQSTETDDLIQLNLRPPDLAKTRFADGQPVTFRSEQEGVMLELSGSKDTGTTWRLFTTDEDLVGRTFKVVVRDRSIPLTHVMTIGPTPDHALQTTRWIEPAEVITVEIREHRE